MAVPAGRELQMRADRLADVGEGRPYPRVASGDARTECQHRHALARMLGAAPGGVVAMVGGDDGQISGFQQRRQFRQASVEMLERRGIARHVAPVAVERIEIDEVCEDEAAVWRVRRLRQKRVERRVIAMRLSSPPPGYANWTLRLLARKVVELEIVDSISHETVRQTLKKTE